MNEKIQKNNQPEHQGLNEGSYEYWKLDDKRTNTKFNMLNICVPP